MLGDADLDGRWADAAAAVEHDALTTGRAYTLRLVRTAAELDEIHRDSPAFIHDRLRWRPEHGPMMWVLRDGKPIIGGTLLWRAGSLGSLTYHLADQVQEEVTDQGGFSWPRCRHHDVPMWAHLTWDDVAVWRCDRHPDEAVCIGTLDTAGDRYANPPG